MIIIVGPLNTDEQRGDMAEAAGLYGAVPAALCDFDWASVTDVYRLPGWATCPEAEAVAIVAEIAGAVVTDVR
ncbi:hypothetical protein OG709_30090 [Streptomyces sp. NBC_01267]|uniref:hypothetical protein n=1 Tax=Streptomyces sp. NBC_01267 TaxID=2903805 RepID=UPI002E33F350|nr:hypothetical protein [Streptomyces sp. NBC_01267]